MQFRAKPRPNIIDVANYFLLKEEMTHKKLQLLCYYAEAWSEAILDAPICENNEFQAWVHGPVNLRLWEKFEEYGWNTLEVIAPDQTIDELKGKFTENQLDLLENVWYTYGELTSNALEILVHQEIPWQEQRLGLNPFALCSNIISINTMKTYYRSIANDQIQEAKIRQTEKMPKTNQGH